MINEEVIARFLEGRNQKKYIVGVEIPYGSADVSLIINDPERGKFISKDSLTSFVWFKEEITKIMYGGKRTLISKSAKKYGVTITKLKTSMPNQAEAKRMKNGYKYMAKVKGSYTKLQKFFKDGGIDIYGQDHKNYFIAINPVEQYLIASGRRLFKGMDDYSDVHRLQFDLETTGLHPKGQLLSREDIEEVKERMGTGEDLTKLFEFDGDNEPIRHKDCKIFQIGIRDNRGFEEIIEVPQEGTKKELREYEAYSILKFFDIINNIKPDVIAGYNSENFDWHFIFTRCDLLGLDIELIAKTLDKHGNSKIRRVDKTLKLGGASEYYKQTTMWGYNIVDVYHAVRRAKAINSNIKSAGLKYITKYSGLNKENRVYVEGNKIFKTWADKETAYAFNDTDGTYYKINEETPLKEGYAETKGAEIVRRYLLDDLWETEQVDGLYNQASFLLSKIIPTSYMRSTTMGTAGIWKLIMLAWSYENRLAIPDLKPRTTFTGGLSRLLEVGYAEDVAKLDFAALYPNIEITWDIFPDTDITGVMKGMLIYIASTRDKFKNLMNQHKGELGKLKTFKVENLDKLKSEDLELLNSQIEKESGLASMYDKKQLPIKILGNSFFGSLGAPNIFNWGDINCAEETTCRGRQYLRLMVKFFMDYDFRPLVGDTDGFNFAIPKNIDGNTYTPKGTHRFTENDKGVILIGLDAVVAEFNELYMIGRMGLDIDDICSSTINFSRKNYANLISGKTKLVGNTIKSSKMPGYIEDFLGEGIKYLLDGDGESFINLYNKTVDDIYNFRIPLLKIASKSNVKDTISSYKTDMKTKTKAGNSKAKKAHMELLIANGVKANLGDVVYYVNIGTTKSQGDAQKVTKLTDEQRAELKGCGKVSGHIETSVKLNCKLIPTDQIESNPNLTTDEYNVPKYLAAFNNRIHALLVCFNPEIREKILMDMVKNKKTKEMELTERNIFTKKDCVLDSGTAFKDGDQNTLTELMDMEDKEIEFWIRVKKTPNNLEELGMNWDEIQVDYHERMRIARIEGIKFEKSKTLEIIKRLEYDEIQKMKKTTEIPKSLSNIGEFTVHDDKEGNPNIFVKSKEWEIDLCCVTDIFKYEIWASQRQEWYQTQTKHKLKNFEGWLTHLWLESKKAGDDKKAIKIKKELELAGVILVLDDYKKVLEKEVI
tara:strand:- start:5092 stop:8589 length:3498 start_codon:yes stop_codon:yes gene_type:complete